MRAPPGTVWFRALTFVVGAAAVGLGVALTLRPFSSLDALTFFVAASLILGGLSELVGSAEVGSPWRDRVAGVALLLAGVVAAGAPGLTVHGIALVVGLGMLLSGAARVGAGWRREVEERYAAVVGGFAGIVFGILALEWPDVTILVVALLVGPVVIVYGARWIFRALPGSRPDKPLSTSRRRVWLRGMRTTVALVFALALVLVSALLHERSPNVPSFYTWSGSLPARAGVLPRQEPTMQGMPAGSRAVRILYTTTGLDGKIVPASQARAGPRPNRVVWPRLRRGPATELFSCGPPPGSKVGHNLGSLREVAVKKLIIQAGSLGAAVLLITAVALAATPINNGLYVDKAHHVSVIVVQKKVATPSIICHGTQYYPVHGVTVKSGRFTYSGKAAVAHGHHPPQATNKTLAINGHFVTKHRVTGTAAVASCKMSYSAKYVGKLR